MPVWQTPGTALLCVWSLGWAPAKAKCVELGENEWVRGAVGTKMPLVSMAAKCRLHAEGQKSAIPKSTVILRECFIPVGSSGGVGGVSSG